MAAVVVGHLAGKVRRNATLLPGRSSRRGSLHQLLVLLSLLDGGGAASLLRPDGHERRGLALAHPEKKDEPDDDRAYRNIKGGVPPPPPGEAPRVSKVGT